MSSQFGFPIINFYFIQITNPRARLYVLITNCWQEKAQIKSTDSHHFNNPSEQQFAKCNSLVKRTLINNVIKDDNKD